MAISRRNRDDIVIKYGADDSNFRKVTDRVLNAGKEVKGVFGKLSMTVSGFFGKGLAASTAAVASSMAVISKRALENADALAKTADKVGLTVERLQELRYAASASGVEQRVLDTAMQRFSRRVGKRRRAQANCTKK